jgi:hypothetical protein
MSVAVPGASLWELKAAVFPHAGCVHSVVDKNSFSVHTKPDVCSPDDETPLGAIGELLAGELAKTKRQPGAIVGGEAVFMEWVTFFMRSRTLR